MAITFNDTELFKTAFNEYAATGDKFIVYFFGSNSKFTNKSWCPDCRQAKPYI